MDPKLTKELALQAVEDIKRAISDDEAAHAMEDGLYLWFINCMAEGMYTKKEAIKISNIIRKVSEFYFARWCA